MLSHDAQQVAATTFKLLPNTTLRFGGPAIIHPRMRAALDELTEHGLLTQTEDRGTLQWQPTAEMQAYTKTLPLPALDAHGLMADPIPYRVP